MLLLELVSNKSIASLGSAWRSGFCGNHGQGPKRPNPWTSNFVFGTCNVTLFWEKRPTHFHRQHGCWNITPSELGELMGNSVKERLQAKEGVSVSLADWPKWPCMHMLQLLFVNCNDGTNGAVIVPRCLHTAVSFYSRVKVCSHRSATKLSSSP